MKIRAALLVAAMCCLAASAAASEIAARGGRVYFVDADHRAVKIRDAQSGGDKDLSQRFRRIWDAVDGLASRR